MSAIPLPLKTGVATSLELALDQVFKLDPALKPRLKPIANKVLKFQFDGPNIALYLLPDLHGIAIQAQYEGSVDCEVNGKPSDYVDLLLADDAASALINGGITVKGETKSLIAMQEIFSDIELDWEYELSKVIGDMAAHQVGETAREIAQRGSSTFKNAVSSLKADLQDDNEYLANKPQIRKFCDDVDDLVSRLERFEAKLSRYSPKNDQ